MQSSRRSRDLRLPSFRDPRFEKSSLILAALFIAIVDTTFVCVYSVDFPTLGPKCWTREEFPLTTNHGIYHQFVEP